MDKRALIIVDSTAKLIECGQDPEDVELACVVAIHVCELVADRIIALTKDGRREGNFVVLIIAYVFTILAIFDLEDELCFVVYRIQQGLGNLWLVPEERAVRTCLGFPVHTVGAMPTVFLTSLL